ncbi:MAG: 50S ribosomal protein L9 [Rickettsiales bacterium]|nr:50S ribosomal protein L9 [Rickettsiales bacterium]
MKVILTSRIKTLGNIGDVKVVADGYGRNYLLPKKLALIYSEKNYKAFEERRKAIEEEDAKRKATALDVMSKLENKELILIESAGDNDRLYGSISSTKLANFVNTLLKNKVVDKNSIYIKEPIKTLGKFTITFDLHPEVSLDKDIIVARSKEEAEKIKKGEFVRKDEKKKIVDEAENVKKEDNTEADAKKKDKKTEKEETK